MYFLLAMFVYGLSQIVPVNNFSNIANQTGEIDDNRLMSSLVMSWYPNPFVRSCAVNITAAKLFRDPCLASVYLHLKCFDDDYFVKCEVLEILHTRNLSTQYSKKLAVSLFLTANTDEESIAIIHALTPIAKQIPETARAARKLLKSPYWVLKLHAIELLGNIGLPAYESIPDLFIIALSGNGNVRKAAWISLGQIICPASLPRTFFKHR